MLRFSSLITIMVVALHMPALAAAPAATKTPILDATAQKDAKHTQDEAQQGQSSLAGVSFGGNACPGRKTAADALTIGPDGAFLVGSYPEINLKTLAGGTLKRGLCSAIIKVQHPPRMQFRLVGAEGTVAGTSWRSGDVLALKTNFQGEHNEALAEKDLSKDAPGKNGAWSLTLVDSPWSSCGQNLSTLVVGLSGRTSGGTGFVIKEGTRLSLSWRPCPPPKQ